VEEAFIAAAGLCPVCDLNFDNMMMILRQQLAEEVFNILFKFEGDGIDGRAPLPRKYFVKYEDDYSLIIDTKNLSLDTESIERELYVRKLLGNTFGLRFRYGSNFVCRGALSPRLLGQHLLKIHDHSAARIALSALKKHPDPTVNRCGIDYTENGLEKGKFFYDWTVINYDKAVKIMFFAVMQNTEYAVGHFIKLPLFEQAMMKFFADHGGEALNLYHIDSNSDNHNSVKKRIALAMLDRVGALQSTR
jgi:hypothetical protein